MAARPHRDLIVPVVERLDGGELPCAWVGLRTGKATRTVQPDPGMLVHFYLGSDERPIGFSIFGYLDGPGVARIVQRYVEWEERGARGTSRRSRRPPSGRRMVAVLAAVERAAVALEGGS